MAPMHFERIDPKHVLSLLDFENRNRHFFETYIAPRDNAFYSLDGVGNHISELQYLAKCNRALSFVLIGNNRIVARANLKNIESKCAEIGYRVSEEATGKGVASLCVEFLISEAKRNGIVSIKAEVMDNNRASDKVLLKNSYVPTLCYLKKYLHNNTPINSVLYEFYVE